MADQITYIPVSALRESPFNPRKAFDPAGLLDLAESIKGQGVLQPIVVRPLPPGQADIEHRYEIVFGHRRFRAASALPDYRDGTLGLPCILREMDDQDVAIAQVAENLQRADVTAIEEADSFRHLHWHHNLSADAIAERVGKSRSYVYARLKLAAAGDDVRTAVLQQGLLPEVALEVARLRGDKLQRMGLQAIRDAHGDWFSQRQAKAAIRDMLTKHRLDAAPFDKTDADLVHTAPACTGCPKRAGNDPDLVAQGIAADVCTDPQCYGDKLRAHSARVVVQLKAEGKPVIEAGEAAKLFKDAVKNNGQPAGYWPVDDGHCVPGWRWNHDEGRTSWVNLTLDEALADLTAGGVEFTPPVRTAIVDQETGLHANYITQDDRRAIIELWKRLQEDLRKRAEAAKAASTPSTAAHARGERADEPDLSDWSPAECAALDHDSILHARDAALRNMLTMPRTTDDLRLIILREHDLSGELGSEPILCILGLSDEYEAARSQADDAGDEFDGREWWIQRLATLTADQLGQIVLGVAVGELFERVPEWQLRQPKGFAEARSKARFQAELAKRFGVDLATAKPNEVKDDADGCAAGGRTTTTEPVIKDLFGDESNNQTDNAGGAAEKPWPFPKRAAA